MKPAAQKKEAVTQRLRISVRGAVQGVGFRPFVFRLATELGLHGWVNNSSQGVHIDVEGEPEKIRSFLLRLNHEKPARSFIQSLESAHLDAVGHTEFQIRPSDEGGEKTALVLPDIATCPDCLAEIFDPGDRRYRYPFTNCTNCGPRYSIIEELPYDRPHTSMKMFEMCEACREEYEDPLDRRFHAQPNACPVCGPHVEFWDGSGYPQSSHDEAVAAAVRAIRIGKIVAVKGIGGFHLLADARNDNIVRELRKRKHREEKPLAVMAPTLKTAEEMCEVSDLERRLLTSPEAPIVLLKAKHSPPILSRFIAPGNPYLGVMLPYTPLHHLLMEKFGSPVVATSGNLSDEPICTDEREAVTRLKGIADCFLIHNRPIVRHVDDSIVRVALDREMMVRRARGFAPLPIDLGSAVPPTLAVGAHLKNAVVVASGRQAFVSQHIGDLETEQAFGAFRGVIESVERLYDTEPDTVAFDLHPDYLSTKWAMRSGSRRRVQVQHHFAHILSCMAENDVSPPVLGIAWDGTGLGTDGTIWGGEFLRVNSTGFERVAHLRTFRLPGGDLAVREPRRSAFGVLYEFLGQRAFEMKELPPATAFTTAELGLIRAMLSKSVNSPITSSAGRLFDAVASIIGLRHRARFEGQAAMELEFLVDENEPASYDFSLHTEEAGPTIVDWGSMIRGVIDDTADGIRPSRIAAKFHNTLVEMMIRVARIAGEAGVVLSGGCFQNKVLIERAVTRLSGEGFRVYWHQRVPTNDGGIALGQAVAATLSLRNG